VVKIVRLPSKPDGSKQGVDDFLAAGGTIDDLEALAVEYSGRVLTPSGWPVLAEEAYHGIAGQIVRAIEPNTEADPAGLLILFLASFGNVIGRGAHFRVEGDAHFCKLWPVLVGETSKGRKGTAQGRVNAVLDRVEPAWSKGCTAGGLSSGEGLIHHVRDRVLREGKDGETITVDEGVSDKRLFIEEPEFASPLTVMRREGNNLSMVLRNAWDERVLRSMTKNSSEKSTGSHVTVVGHVTKGELMRHLTDAKLGSGIANRFLFVLVQRSKYLPHGGSRDEIQGELVSELRGALEFGRVSRSVSLSEEVEEDYGYSASELWEEVYPDLSAGKTGLFGAVVSRSEAYVRRLATLYAVLDRTETVRVKHLLAGLAVWQYAEESARIIFADRTGDELADEVLALLEIVGAEGLTASELHGHFSHNLSGRRLRGVLDELAEAGRVVMVKEKRDGPGRPTERWYATDE